jgi:hypothetical protein
VPRDALPGGWDWKGRSLVVDCGFVRRAKAGEEPIGVFSCNPGLVGDSAELGWRGRYLKDEFGQIQMRDAVFVRWREKLTEEQDVARRRPITQTIRCAKTAEHAEMQETDIIKDVDGRWTRCRVQERVAGRRVVTQEAFLHDSKGHQEVDVWGRPIMTQVPVMENVEVEDTTSYVEKVFLERGYVMRQYRVKDIPADVSVPEDAEYFTISEPISNPDYDPKRLYIPRSRRPEWLLVGLIGKVLLYKGEPTSRKWVKMRDVSDRVEEWFVK